MPTNPLPDCYAILGVPPQAPEDAIREAYHALAKSCQAERAAGSQDEARRKLSGIVRAYEILGDPMRRRRYDLHRRIDASTAPLTRRDASKVQAFPTAARARHRQPAPRHHYARAALLLVALVILVAALYHYLKPQAAALRAQPLAPATLSPAPTPPAETATPPAPPVAAPAPVAPSVLPPAPALPAVTKPAPAPAKPAPSRAAGNRPENAAAPPGEACTDVTAALGLCKPVSTTKDK